MATYGRTLSVKVDLGLDAALAKDPGEYMKLAKEFAEKKNLVGGAVKECVYNCQGYSLTIRPLLLMYMASAGNVLPSRFPDMTGPYWGFPWMQTKKSWR